MRRRSALLFSTACALLAALFVSVSPASAAPAVHKVIVDTDIGDDIDDAFALGLLLASPEVEIVGITTAWGDTRLRARLVQRLLRETGRGGIPVAFGTATTSTTPFTQARWAQRGPEVEALPPADAFIVDQLKRHPGEITLVALAPLTNVAAALRRDPAAFKGVKRIVMMGGSVRRGYAKSVFHAPRPPDAEYNIAADVGAAQTVFAAGVELVVMPLDSTQLRFEETPRNALFAQGSPLTDAIALLYHQWLDAYQPWSSATPTLFDVLPVAWLIDPTLCPTTPLHLVVDDKGMTQETTGAANAQVCLASDAPRAIELLMQRLRSPATAAR